MKDEGSWLPWVLGAIIETGLYLGNTKDLKCSYFCPTLRIRVCRGSQRVVSCPLVGHGHFSIFSLFSLWIGNDRLVLSCLCTLPWIPSEQFDEITRITTTVPLKSTTFKFSAIVSIDVATLRISEVGATGAPFNVGPQLLCGLKSVNVVTFCSRRICGSHSVDYDEYGMWCRVVRWKLDVSKECTTSIFRVRVWKHETSKKQAANQGDLM
jgi:hypothetical protein